MILRRLGIIAALVGVSLAGSPAAHAATTVPVASGPDTSQIRATRAGDLTLVDAVQRGTVLERGASATQFSLDLPKDASCPGDSESDNWRVQTFMIPADHDPAVIVYSANGPSGEGENAIYDGNTNSVVDLLTVPNGQAGLPGRIQPFLTLSLGVFTTALLPPGQYRIGVACTYFGATADYWDTTIEVVADANDQPGGFTWRLPDAPAGTLSGAKDPSSFPLTWVFLAIAAAALGFVVVLNRRSAAQART